MAGQPDRFTPAVGYSLWLLTTSRLPPQTHSSTVNILRQKQAQRYQPEIELAGGSNKQGTIVNTYLNYANSFTASLKQALSRCSKAEQCDSCVVVINSYPANVENRVSS
jgi:hypothetical protein